ncbi:hypothetical protein PVAP13_6KG288212 [Panicum virgatum]|uniref:Uncharacterized protein n=1 Tax=Panicum virgatum TaxID=38727 RepID=A0A8T0RE07_PANVG|nr:hypothetical protein PVAP13_6KG288212 [Panicum virgatum]
MLTQEPIRHGTAAGEQAPRWESPTAIDGQRPRERAGTAVVAGLRGHRGRGGGEEGRGPRTTTRGGEPWLSVERARGGRASGAPVNCAPEIVADTPCPSKKLAPVKDGASAGRAAHRTRGKCLDHDDRLPAQQVVTRAYLIDVSLSMEL